MDYSYFSSLTRLLRSFVEVRGFSPPKRINQTSGLSLVNDLDRKGGPLRFFQEIERHTTGMIVVSNEVTRHLVRALCQSRSMGHKPRHSPKNR